MPELNHEALSPKARHLLAFSGGPDSLRLLAQLLAAGLGDRLRVVHVDHGLDAESRERARGARDLAASLGATCEIRPVRIRRSPRDGGLEAAARRARYACLASLMQPGDYLLTAHHADDQAETVMLRLLRGAGPEGLAGMRALRAFGPGWLGRPLLHWSRAEIESSLARTGLQPLDDPTNRDPSRDRNFLRHAVLPLLAERWPGYRRAVTRVGQRQQHAADAVRERARRDFGALRRVRETGETVLDRTGWLDVGLAAALEVVAYWCNDLGIPVPPTNRLEAFREQCTGSAADAVPRLEWDGIRMHAWDDAVWIDPAADSGADWASRWLASKGAPVPSGGRLRIQPKAGEAFGESWRVGPVEPGARLRLEPGGPRRRVSELLRLSRIPPWRRAALPALRIDGTLRAVATEWQDHEFSAWLQRSRSRLVWHDRPTALLPCRSHLPRRRT